MLKQSAQFAIGLYIRTAIMAITIIILAKNIAVAEYGAYVSAIAIIGIFTPFLHGGMAYVYLDSQSLADTSHISVEKTWVNILVLSGALIGVVLVPLLNYIFGISFLSYRDTFLISITEITLIGLCEIKLRSAQKDGSGIRMGWWQIIPHALRLTLFIIAIYIIRLKPDISTWVISSIIACTLLGFYIFISVSKNWHGTKPLSVQTLIRKSLNFGIGGSSIKVMTEIDKPIISKILDTTYSANYSIAQRLIDLAVTPVQAILPISLSKMIESSPLERTRIMANAILLGLAIAIIIAFIVVLATPLLINFLGPSYSNVQSYVLFLLWVPIAVLIRGTLGNWFASNGRGDIYSNCHIAGAITRCVTCVYFVKYYGIFGAILSLAVAELCVTLLMTYFFLKIKRNILINEKS